MKKSRKIIIWVVVIAVVILIVAGVVKKIAIEKDTGQVVRIEEVQRGDLTEIISAPGEIEPKRKVEISAKVSARIVALPYDEGDVVTKGRPDANPPAPASVLVRLDSKDLESRLLSAQASRAAQAAQRQVEKARIESQKATIDGLLATLKQAEEDLKRKQGLIDSKDISQAAYDQVKYKVDELQAQYEAAKHTLESAELNLLVLQHNLEAADAGIDQAKEALSYAIITSPIDGVVTRINAEEGEMAMTGTMNNPGTVIMEVADLSQMLVVAQVDEADVGELKAGQHVKAYVQAFGDIVFTGTVDTIALTHRFNENRTKYFRTEILLEDDPNVEKLYSVLTTDVDIDTQKHTNVIKVPSQAVLARPVDELPLDIRENCPQLDTNKTFATVVYRYNDGKAVATPVKTGPSDLTDTVITAGLSEKDKVIVGPYKVLDGLKHDQKLRDEREVEAEKKKKKAKDKEPKPDSADVNDAGQDVNEAEK